MDWFPVSIPGLSHFSLPLFIEAPSQEGGTKEVFDEEFLDSPIEETIDDQFMETKHRKKNKTRKHKPNLKKERITIKVESKANPKKRTRKAVKKLRVRKTRRT